MVKLVENFKDFYDKKFIKIPDIFEISENDIKMLNKAFITNKTAVSI